MPAMARFGGELVEVAPLDRLQAVDDPVQFDIERRVASACSFAGSGSSSIR
jgi:hypothetical protein